MSSSRSLIEEPPYFHSAMGSMRFYEDQTDRRGIHAAVVMDLLGAAEYRNLEIARKPCV